MTAYDAHELAAAKEQDRLDDEAFAAELKAIARVDYCEQYAQIALEEGKNWSKVLEEYHNTTDPESWPDFYEQIRLLIIAKPEEREMKKWAVIETLSRAVDRGCLLED